jgi:hypothetical protein
MHHRLFGSFIYGQFHKFLNYHKKQNRLSNIIIKYMYVFYIVIQDSNHLIQPIRYKTISYTVEILLSRSWKKRLFYWYSETSEYKQTKFYFELSNETTFKIRIFDCMYWYKMYFTQKDLVTFVSVECEKT